MLITQSNSWESGVRKRTVRSELKLGPVSLKFVVIALIAVAALFYLAQKTQGAALQYQVSELEVQKDDALKNVEEAKVNAARYQSLNEIKNSAASLNLVAPN